jgi:DNA-binding NarL/FixJ family response regulator
MVATVLVVDDHPLFRDALSEAVRRALPDYELAQCGSIGAAAEYLSATPSVHIVLLDLMLHDAHGFQGLLQLRALAPDARFLMVSATEDPLVIRRALDCGACGYVTKSSGLDDMVEAITTVAAGAPWTPQEMTLPDHDHLASQLSSLTPAQAQVLRGLGVGKLNKQIAYDLGISEATVKAHLTALFRKLHVINRTQAVLFARQMGEISRIREAAE